jgi:1-acyl-sn-glycerol-3-phosphate acyltransferase
VLDPSAERYFIVGNHQSIIDIPVLLWACRGRLRFLAKDSLFRVPLFGPLIYRLGHVPVARSRPREAHEVLRAVVQCVSRHRHSLAAFPEGTRSEDGRLLQFRQGTMKIGQRSGLPILPFAIRGSGAVVRPRVFRAHPGPVELHFGLPIPAEEAARLSPAELTERIQEQVQRLLRLEPGEREAVPPGAGVGADAAPRTNDA